MSVWPEPKSVTTGTDKVWLSADLQYSYESASSSGGGNDAADLDVFSRIFSGLLGVSDASLPSKAPDFGSNESRGDYIEQAFQKAKTTLLEKPFVPHKMYPRNVPFEPSPSQELPIVDTIRFRELSPGNGGAKAGRKLSPESYSIHLDADGRCVVYVMHPLGAIRALSTFLQLFYGVSEPVDRRSPSVYSPHAPLVIQDEPLFAHRGVNIDICRNVITPRAIIRTLAGMWLCKLNRLHIHATDSQSWPLMIPSMPELAEKGAYRPSQIWHPADLQAVQEYGRSLGIEVYLEIDMPGHTGSICHSHPDLTLAYDARPWDKWAVEPPAGQLKLNSPDVHNFMGKLLDDLAPRVREYTSSFHVGGDELNTNCYTLEKGIESADKAVLRPFLQRFFDVVFATLDKHELTPIMWEDILLDFDLDFPKDSVFQVWRGHDSLAKILAQGYRAIAGPSDFWYLDVGLGTFLDPDPDNKDSPVKPPFADWNPPYKNWRLVYSYDPFKGVPEQHHAQIIGGEVSNWGELTDSVNLDGMLWPRVAAAAEVLWKGPRTPSEAVTRRLAELRERLVLEGIAANVVQMEWSLKHKGRGTL